MKLTKIVAGGLGLVLLGVWAVSSAEVDLSKIPPASDKTGLTYEKEIKPILDKNCIKCHGNQKPKGKLTLLNLAGILKGGEDGKVIVPGNSAKSKLVQAVARLNDDEAMPPEGKGKPLSKEDIGLIRAWIDQGAK